jgi:2'-5' RNA ligase
MDTKRIFIGTFIDHTLFQPVMPEIIESFDGVSTGKWTEIENLHYTYKFLGNVDVAKIDEIQDSLKNYLKEYESVFQIGGMGAFPNPEVPRLIFARVFNQDKSVFYYFNGIEKAMIKLGFEKERRRFVPHVTLKRLKSFTPEFPEIMDKMKDISFGLMKSYKINLIESTLTPTGPIYNIRA